MNSHTITSQRIRARNAKRVRNAWLSRNALGLAVTAGIVLGLIGGLFLVVIA